MIITGEIVEPILYLVIAIVTRVYQITKAIK